jgi:hypothetical protein
MPRNAQQLQTRVGAHDRSRIGVTDSTGFHPNPNLTGSGLTSSQVNGVFVTSTALPVLFIFGYLSFEFQFE